MRVRREGSHCDKKTWKVLRTLPKGMGVLSEAVSSLFSLSALFAILPDAFTELISSFHVS